MNNTYEQYIVMQTTTVLSKLPSYSKMMYKSYKWNGEITKIAKIWDMAKLIHCDRGPTYLKVLWIC